MDKQHRDHYQVLGVSPQADRKTIDRAYRKVKNVFSLSNPEIYNFFTKEEAVQWLRVVEEAHSALIKKQSDKKQPDKSFVQSAVSHFKPDREMENLISSCNIFDGVFLRKVREYKNIELDDFSRMTCIKVSYLKAIESNDHSRLPAPVFVRGYIIQYCSILGLDKSKVVPSYISLLTKNGFG